MWLGTLGCVHCIFSNTSKALKHKTTWSKAGELNYLSFDKDLNSFTIFFLNACECCFSIDFEIMFFPIKKKNKPTSLP